jgi:hypothetical protein
MHISRAGRPGAEYHFVPSAFTPSTRHVPGDGWAWESARAANRSLLARAWFNSGSSGTVLVLEAQVHARSCKLVMRRTIDCQGGNVDTHFTSVEAEGHPRAPCVGRALARSHRSPNGSSASWTPPRPGATSHSVERAALSSVSLAESGGHSADKTREGGLTSVKVQAST